MLLPTRKVEPKQKQKVQIKYEFGSQSTEKETRAPADLLIRAGYIRQSSSGVFTLLPFAQRVIEKIVKIIDEEMANVGGQKITLPNMLPTENWEKTGRWNKAENELFSLKDRKGSTMLLAPTHEEEITSIISQEVHSYRQLPLRLYQISNKFRDELRPRSGLLRGREFLMKDMYSFDINKANALAAYEDLKQAYINIFNRLSVPYAMAEADSGNIGGSLSHEFHFLNQDGEDTLLLCSKCGYTANEERAQTSSKPKTLDNNPTSHNKPASSMDELFSCTSEPKYTIYISKADKDADENMSFHMFILPGGRVPNPTKYKKHPASGTLVPGQLIQVTTKDKLLSLIERNTKDSFSSPLSVSLFIDESTNIPAHNLETLENIIVAENKNTVLQHIVGDWITVVAGDGCPKCGPDQPLDSSRAIEVGHIFYLGKKYSSVLDAKAMAVSDGSKNAPQPVHLEMGCYGIGVSRVLQAIADHQKGSFGLRWPLSIAPFRACIVPIESSGRAIKDHERIKTMLDMGTFQIADSLAGIEINGERPFKGEIAIDDRNHLSVGYRLNDTELLGFPVVIILGKDFFSSNGQLAELKIFLPQGEGQHETQAKDTPKDLSTAQHMSSIVKIQDISEIIRKLF